jgi:REP element-mobilizing transposase RayT
MSQPLLFKDRAGLPERKSPRHPGWDYSAGDIFVTACTKGHRHDFGFIQHDRMWLTPLGEQLAHELETEVHRHYPYATVPLWTVMPNHFHAVVHLEATESTPDVDTHSSLSRLMGGLKASVSRFASRQGIPFEWQSSYYDHVVRNVSDARRIADYIEHNVISWAMDRFYEE